MIGTAKTVPFFCVPFVTFVVFLTNGFVVELESDYSRNYIVFFLQIMDQSGREIKHPGV
jgi:hypothetical protein